MIIAVGDMSVYLTARKFRVDIQPCYYTALNSQKHQGDCSSYVRLGAACWYISARDLADQVSQIYGPELYLLAITEKRGRSKSLRAYFR